MKKKKIEGKNQHVVITNVNTSIGIKILSFLVKSWGMMLYLSDAPLNWTIVFVQYVIFHLW